mmetsp:Transcript_10407/g.38596  ORF Transcript_10407/g.38596 Transcript_10407/m.38596 type:complete len:404 (+) Transcript_10407:1770-2981(+)
MEPAGRNPFRFSKSTALASSSPTEKGVPPSSPIALARETRDMGCFALGSRLPDVDATPVLPFASVMRTTKGCPTPAAVTVTTTGSRRTALVLSTSPSGIILRNRASKSASLVRHTKSPRAGALGRCAYCSASSFARRVPYPLFSLCSTSSCVSQFHCETTPEAKVSSNSPSATASSTFRAMDAPRSSNTSQTFPPASGSSGWPRSKTTPSPRFRGTPPRSFTTTPPPSFRKQSVTVPSKGPRCRGPRPRTRRWCFTPSRNPLVSPSYSASWPRLNTCAKSTRSEAGKYQSWTWSAEGFSAGPIATRVAQASSSALRYTETVRATYSGPFSLPSILKHATPASISEGTISTAIRSCGDSRYCMSPISFKTPSTSSPYGKRHACAHCPRFALRPPHASDEKHCPL